MTFRPEPSCILTISWWTLSIGLSSRSTNRLLPGRSERTRSWKTVSGLMWDAVRLTPSLSCMSLICMTLVALDWAICVANSLMQMTSPSCVTSYREWRLDLSSPFCTLLTSSSYRILLCCGFVAPRLWPIQMIATDSVSLVPCTASAWSLSNLSTSRISFFERLLWTWTSLNLRTSLSRACARSVFLAVFLQGALN